MGQGDIFYVVDAKYIQLMVRAKDTGSIWSYFHRYNEYNKALEHYEILKQDKDIEVVWLECEKLSDKKIKGF